VTEESETRFAFGKNWEHFINARFGPNRLSAARRYLLTMLELPDLQDLSFLDIGSGSGLHSLAAWSAGAKQVFSFDCDPLSVKSTGLLRQMAGAPSNWSLTEASVLDEKFMRSLPAFDIVYAWGALHHSGQVWQAIKNAVIPLSPNGLFYLALYSENRYRDGVLAGHPAPEFWLRLKRDYNQTHRLGRRLLEARHLYRSYFAPFAPNLLKGWRNLQKARARYQAEERGMDFWTDMRDWLGGYPMEFVKEKDCLRLLGSLGLETLRLCCGQGNSEYILRPQQARNAWDNKLQKRRRQTLARLFAMRAGAAIPAPGRGSWVCCGKMICPPGSTPPRPRPLPALAKGETAWLKAGFTSAPPTTATPMITVKNTASAAMGVKGSANVLFAAMLKTCARRRPQCAPGNGRRGRYD
jgi:SAM-dependent methyltransferase